MEGGYTDGNGSDPALVAPLLADGLAGEQMEGLNRAVTLARCQPPAGVAVRAKFLDIGASRVA